MLTWVFEIIIFSYLILSGAFLMHLTVDWKKHRQRPVLWGMGVILIIGWVLIFQGSFIETRRLVTVTQNVSIADQAQDSLKVAVVSDLHIGPYKDFRWTRKVVDRTNELQPDLILLPGDFIFNYETNLEMLDALIDLKAPEGVYAVTGNHDYSGDRSQDVITKLKELGVVVLENEQVVVRPATEEKPRLILAGASDIWFDGNVSMALQGVTEEDQVIFMVHNPDAATNPAANIADLIISGHTHGGQIRLPFLGPLGIIPTELGQEYDRGLFSASRVGAKFGQPGSNQKLFITSGLGETGTRARLFNPPEVVQLFLEF